MAEESEIFEVELQPLENLPASPTTTPTQTLTQSLASPEDGDGSPSAKKRRTSIVWNDFMKKNIGGVDYAFCKHCGTKYKALSKNGTKSLHMHLRKCLKKEGSDTSQPLPPPPRPSSSKRRRKDGKKSQVRDGGGQFGRSTTDAVPIRILGDGEDERFHGFLFNQQVAQKALASAIVMHEYPLSIVDHVGFQSFSSTLQPFFRMASVEEVKSEIKRMHNTKKDDVYRLLEKLTSRVAITADMWTSDSKKSYMSITAHFVDENWVLQKCGLRFVYVPVPHTKEALWNQLTACLLDFNLLKKISTVVTDGSFSSSDEITPANLKNLNSGLLLNGQLLHIQCGAQILKLLAKDCLSMIATVTDKIRDSVVFWTATPSREETFSNTANQVKISYMKKLQIDDPNLWNSTYSMIRAFLDYKEVFLKLKEKESLYTSAPSDEEWDLAADVCGRMELFYGAAKMFSGSKHIPSNNYFLKICEIKEALHKWIASPDLATRQTASLMHSKFEEYWNSVHVVLAIATVLDPRYKLKLVQYFFIAIYGSNSWPEVERIRKCCSDLFDEYRSRFGLVSESTKTAPLEIEASDHLAQYDLFVKWSKPNNMARNTLSELERYLEDPVLPRDQQDFDALMWWKTSGTMFPVLRAMAMDLLSIPISVATSDNAFRFDGRVVPSSRTGVEVDTVETLMCTHNWMWNEMQGTGLSNDSQSNSQTFSEADDN